MSVVLLSQGRLADVADAWRLGIPDRVNTMVPEQTDPAMVTQESGGRPPVFPALVRGSGFRLVLDRIMRLGGSMGGDHTGPAFTHARTRAPSRTPAAGPGVSSVAVRSMPAGLTPTSPWWESYLHGSEGFLAT